MNDRDIDPRAFKPEHAVTHPSVDVPTILVEPLREGEENEVFFQWHGDSAGLTRLVEEYGNVVAKVFNEAQFRFSIPMPANDVRWLGYPKLFRVISIDQVINWRWNPRIQKKLLEQHNPESWILEVASKHFTVRNPNNHEGQARFLILLNVLLAEQLYGVITPKKYHGHSFCTATKITTTAQENS